jgi:hypothetical protein
VSEYEKLLKEGKLEEYDQNKQNQQTKATAMFASTAKTAKKDVNARHPYKIFEDTVMVLIVLSSILLAVDNPLSDPKSQQAKIISYIDAAFTVLFTIEASIKIIAKGFAYNKMGPIEPYIKSAWNILDFVVVVASLLDLIFLIFNVDID